MKFFIFNKLVGIVLIPIRYFIINYFKLDRLQGKFTINDILILDKCTNTIKWDIEDAYLVKITKLGIVNTNGELTFPSNRMPNIIQLTAYGYKRTKRKTKKYKLIQFKWTKVIHSEYVQKVIKLKGPTQININLPVTHHSFPNPRINLKKPILSINTEEIQKELETIKSQKT